MQEDFNLICEGRHIQFRRAKNIPHLHPKYATPYSSFLYFHSLTKTKTVGIGAASSGLLSLYWDTIYEKAKKQGKAWTTSPELHRLPVSCLAGPCLTIALFWLAWTSNPNIHWSAPVLSGLLFGFGYQIIFISLLTYVTDAYKIYSASALAASVFMRSIAGAVFPLAAEPLYATLGVAWTTSVLGFASLACIPIPFVLLYAGPWIRGKSAFCLRLAEDTPKEELDRGLESGSSTPTEV